MALDRPSSELSLPGMVKDPVEEFPAPPGSRQTSSESLEAIQAKLDKLTSQMDQALAELLSIRTSQGSQGTSTPVPQPGTPSPSTSRLQRASMQSRLSLASGASSFSHLLQENGRLRRFSMASFTSQLTRSTVGSTMSNVTLRNNVIPFNEFGAPETVSRNQLARRLRLHRRRPRQVHMSKQGPIPGEPGAAAASHLLAQHDGRWDKLWLLLDDPESSRTAWWIALVLKVLVVLSICMASLEVDHDFAPPLNRAVAVTQGVIDGIFLLEFLCRFLSARSKTTYITDFYNWADVLSAAGLLFRALAGFELNFDPFQVDYGLNFILLFVYPQVHLLKMLRYIESFRLLTDAVANSLESLPVLVYTMLLMVLASASGIYLFESRVDLPTLSNSVWLSLVTMTTVGYGDFAPKTTGGCVIASILTVASVLFIAMPVGLIGYEFTLCWQSRHRVLLLARARKRFAKWGYHGSDVQLLFEFADTDKDGTLNLLEFCELLSAMSLRLTDNDMVDLFTVFDENQNGLINLGEFVQTLFPDQISDMDSAESESVDVLDGSAIVPASQSSIARSSIISQLPVVQEVEATLEHDLDT